MRKSVKIDDLNLALDNPRLTESQNEGEELEKMVKEQKRKLLILADDIIDHGLNPLDIIAVYPSEKHEGKYVVAEGNRRISVIKILNDPDIISKIDEVIYKSFSQLKLKYKKKIDSVEAWVFNNSADPALAHWIEIRHMGEQKGKGISKWDGIQKERYDQKVRGESRLLDFWAELEKYSILTYDEIMSITKTNWERILRDSGIKFLGLHKIGNALIVPKDELTPFEAKIRCIQKHLANKTVAIVYDQEKIDSFFDIISNELYGKPNKKEEQLKILLPEVPISGVENELANSTIKKDINITEHEDNTGLSIGKDIFNGCRTVIPNAFYIRSSNTRINKIIKELKSLAVDDYPNSCGALLRLLFELSSKNYIENKKNINLASDDFMQVIRGAANELRKSKQIEDIEHSAILKDTDTLRLLFNGYMHNTDAYPSSEAIKSIFKAHKKFILECLKQ